MMSWNKTNISSHVQLKIFVSPGPLTFVSIAKKPLKTNFPIPQPSTLRHLKYQHLTNCRGSLGTSSWNSASTLACVISCLPLQLQLLYRVFLYRINSLVSEPDHPPFRPSEQNSTEISSADTVARRGIWEIPLTWTLQHNLSLLLEARPWSQICNCVVQWWHLKQQYILSYFHLFSPGQEVGKQKGTGRRKLNPSNCPQYAISNARFQRHEWKWPLTRLHLNLKWSLILCLFLGKNKKHSPHLLYELDPNQHPVQRVIQGNFWHWQECRMVLYGHLQELGGLLFFSNTTEIFPEYFLPKGQVQHVFQSMIIQVSCQTLDYTPAENQPNQ